MEALLRIFATYGLPEKVVLDNIPQLTYSEFEDFLKKNGSRHTLVPAYHPASNRAAERSAQIVKSALRKQVLQEKAGHSATSVQHKFANFVLVYRTTPHIKM